MVGKLSLLGQQPNQSDLKHQIDALKYYTNAPDEYAVRVNNVVDEVIQAQMAQAQNFRPEDLYSALAHQVSDPGHSHSIAMNGPFPVNKSQKAASMLFGRLHGISGTFEMKKDDFMLPIVTNDKVFIFFIHESRAGHLEDDAAIFPSDKLITQIRLLWS